MAYSSANFTANVWPTKATTDHFYVEAEQSERWVCTFEILRTTFTGGTWMTDNVPARGVATPAEITGGVSVGTVLNRHVDYRNGTVAGYVVLTLTCGWSGWNWYESLSRVSSRQVTVREKLTFALNGTTALSGPVGGEEETQQYVVDGDQYHDVTYTEITIESVVSSIPAGWQGSNFGKRNQAAVTIRKVVYPLGTVLYTGGSSGDIPASQSPTKTAAYRLTIVLLASAKVWPLTVDRYVETKKIVQLDVVNAAGAKISDGRAVQWVRAAAKTDSPTIRGAFDMVTAIAALP